jgi:hypothetical protein
MHEKAAEDVSRILDKPGLKQVVRVAEREQAEARGGGQPRRPRGGHWSADTNTNAAPSAEQRNGASGANGLAGDSHRYE